MFYTYSLLSILFAFAILSGFAYGEVNQTRQDATSFSRRHFQVINTNNCEDIHGAVKVVTKTEVVTHVTHMSRIRHNAGIPTQTPDAGEPDQGANTGGNTVPSDWREEMLLQVNAVRQKENRPPLKLNAALSSISQAHSDYQFNIKKMTHDDPVPMGDRVTAAGLIWAGIAENVAWNQKDVTAAVQAWVNSPGHHANMVGDYDIVGFGESNRYWTQNFVRLRNKPLTQGYPVV